MGKGSGISRSDRRRNARRERLRELLPRDGAVLGIDLGDARQALALVDHDMRVLWRRTARVGADRLGGPVADAIDAAAAAGVSRVTVACEPTGPRWMQVQRLCREAGVALVCVQPLVSHIAREQEDYTGHKRDEPDAVLIARLAAELHCYIPEELDESWACLRQLGRRREQLVTAATAAVQRIRDFLSVAWPSAVTAAAEPFRSLTWLAALEVAVSCCGADPARLAATGEEGLLALVRDAAGGWGLKRLHRGIALRLLAETEADMAALLTELGLARLGDVPGLTLAGAAVILAETGDPRRYETSGSVVKHAGLSPSDNASGAFEGASRISRRGRPSLRLAAWRATLPLISHNPVMKAKYEDMVSSAEQAARAAAGSARPGSAQAVKAGRNARAARAKARVACAAALLRWIYFMTVHGADWDPVAASGGRLAAMEALQAA